MAVLLKKQKSNPFIDVCGIGELMRDAIHVPDAVVEITFQALVTVRYPIVVDTEIVPDILTCVRVTTVKLVTRVPLPVTSGEPLSG